MHRFRVTAENGEYPVVVGSGAWKELRTLTSNGYSSVFVLSEKLIWNRWAADFSRDSGLKSPKVIFVPSGEKSKSLAQAERVTSHLLKQGADRKSLLVLFGGGVIGDLGGFVASTYMRGIDCIQVPTTVVGQVDSAVGGKTAVNIAAMKNLVGTFYPPRMVLADPRVLGSLGPRTFRSGIYEVVKHAILDGPVFFEVLDLNLASLVPANAPKLEGIIAQAVKVKVDVVNRDERESSLRQVLNLGHTFGHALEEVTGYRRFLHGEAVGWGLLAVTLLAERLGYLHSSSARQGRAASEGRKKSDGPRADSDAERIRCLIGHIGPLPPIRDVSPKAIARLLPHDKKAVGGEIRWVIPERIGKVRVVTGVPLAEAEATWKELQQHASRDELKDAR